MGRFQTEGQRSFFPWERRGGLLRRAGFHRLRPLLAVIAVASLVITVAAREREQAGIRQTRALIVDVRRAVDLYLADHQGRCPASFEELVKASLLGASPRDAWGNPLTLICTGNHAGQNYRLVSAGPDGLVEGLDRIE